jgi:hypothetical protein
MVLLDSNNSTTTVAATVAAAATTVVDTLPTLFLAFSTGYNPFLHPLPSLHDWHDFGSREPARAYTSCCRRKL